MSHIQEAARTLIDQGFSVIPVKEDKKSKGPWKEYTSRKLNEDEISKKFNGSERLAIICGQVSGNLELVDVDDVECWEPFTSLIKAKHSDILDRLVFTKTPNGYGIAYRCEMPPPGNMKLAATWDEVEKAGEYTWNDRVDLKAKEIDGKWIVSACRLETRGEAGYFLASPSPGYEVLEGAFENLKSISEEDRNSIITLARSFDLRPVEHRSSGSEKRKAEVDDRLTIPYPGDIYNREVDFHEQLTEYGWQKVSKKGDLIHYSRPGRKNKIGGTLYPDNKFHVFSSNAAPLEEGHQYTAFAMLTLMDFEGDFSASTKHIVDLGFTVELTPEELKEILEDNPDQLNEAFNRSGMSEAAVCQVAIEVGLELPPGKRPDRISVHYDKLELNRVVKETDQAISSVCGDWGYYQFSDRLGYVTEDNTFKAYDKDTLELRAEQSMFMTQWTLVGKKKKLEAVRVHDHVLRKLLNYPDSLSPTIKGFARHPVVLQGGEVAGLKDGFDHGIMFKNCNGFQVDSRSWKECYDRIVELFCDDILFKDQKVGEALFVSMLMTALCRLGIDGGCPGYFITANEPGTGKSTMFEFISRLVYGRMAESVDWGTDPNERRKEIIAYLREGIECFLFDNIKQGEEVESPILAQAISAGEFKARIMGKGEMTYVPAQSMFVFIGNNLNMSTELSRRLMTIELLARSSNPARREVKINNIPRYCDEHRVEVIGCLLKMVKESFEMDEKIERSSGFAFWDKMVRNPILKETGIDIEQGFDISAEKSEESFETASLIRLLAKVFGVGGQNTFTTRDVYLAIADERFLSEWEMGQAGMIRKDVEDECRDLRDGMVQVNALTISGNAGKSVGKVLSTLNDRVVDNFRLVRHKTKAKTAVKHWIEIEDVNEILK